MALPNPTSQVVTSLGIILQDILQNNTQVLNRNNAPVNFKAVQVQYNGYITLQAPSASTGFTPVAPVTAFAVAYARNAGTSQVQIQYQYPNFVNSGIATLDPGAIFLYVSPLLSSLLIGGFGSGITAFNLFTASTGTAQSIVEVLVAG